MKNEPEATKASQPHTAAYAVPYTERDMPLALQLYKKLMSSYSNAQEADSARMRVQN